MKPLIISAPFGVYHKFIRRLTGADFTPTLGTYTWYPRTLFDRPYGGRFLRTLLTVRYHHEDKSWTNRIGLKNPGIHSCPEAEDAIISVFGANMYEWTNLLETTGRLNPLGVELNLSCPNIDKPPFTAEMFDIAVRNNKNVIAKIPPVGYETLAATAYKHGVRNFHASNTLPTKHGGKSGKALQPYALAATKFLRTEFPDVTIIGGGGITGPDDARRFLDTGADRVAVGTMLFNPGNWRKLKDIAACVNGSMSGGLRN